MDARIMKDRLFFLLICLSLLALISMMLWNPAGASPANGDPPPPPVKREAPLSKSPQQPEGPLAVLPATANELALAMEVPAADLVSADLMGSDTAAVGVSNTALGSFFPTAGSTFAILSTGLAADATLPNDEENHSGTLGGINNDQGNDIARLHLQLKVPGTANCASFDFAYYSEEFPEYVNSIFNDTFTAQLNTSAITTTNNIVTAPGNFAFDTQDNIISVNTVFGVSSETGTTYDGATPLLRARTAVVPNATIDIYLSVQDLGDSIYDSTVFVDKFFWSEDPNCEGGALVDTDGDGLLDVWETDGLTVSAGGTEEFVDLPAMGADPNHKDIFIEADWMGPPGGGDTHSHAPNPAAITLIVNAFNNAPVSNPDGTTGIHLHVDYGSGSPLVWKPGNWGALSHAAELPHQTFVSTCTGSNFNWSGVDTIKASNLTPGRAAVFHYSLWVHSLCSAQPGTSGISRNASGAAFGSGASDFIVSLGAWTGSVGTTNEQAGTFMHELGHNLGLRHGGPDHTQWKANYLSVMNYSFQTRGLIISGAEGNFDYSRYDLADLTEGSLNETTGINVTAGITLTLGTRYFCGLDDQRADLNASAVDWNCDGDETDAAVSANSNRGMSWNNNATLDTLTSQNDWDNLVYTGGAIGQPGASVTLPAESEIIDITEEQDSTIVEIPSKLYLPVLTKN